MPLCVAGLIATGGQRFFRGSMDLIFLHYGIETPAGRFICADCGKAIRIVAPTTLPPCPDFNPNTHKRKGWMAEEEPKRKSKPAGPAYPSSK